MPSRILLISDLHLEDSRPDITNAFFEFLQSNSGNCTSLYILGDLFEVWIGDDNHTELSLSVAAALRDFASAGSCIYIMHGNRDFLLGEEFAEQCNALLLNERFVLKTDVFSALLIHGDQLCIDDLEYMEFRNMVRNTHWRKDFLAKPLTERSAFAGSARQQSKQATESKSNEIMDVNQAEVEKTLRASGEIVLIHGHTHRPAIHQVELGGNTGPLKARRVVLGDWDESLWFIEICGDQLKLLNQPLDPQFEGRRLPENQIN